MMRKRFPFYQGESSTTPMYRAHANRAAALVFLKVKMLLGSFFYMELTFLKLLEFSTF